MAIPTREIENLECVTTQILVHSKMLVKRCFLRTNAQMPNVQSVVTGMKVSIRGGEGQTDGFGCSDRCVACRRHM